MAQPKQQCEGCKATFEVKYLRFRKNAQGVWVYLCTVCRNKVTPS